MLMYKTPQVDKHRLAVFSRTTIWFCCIISVCHVKYWWTNVPPLDSCWLVVSFTTRNCAISSIQSFSIAKIHSCGKLRYLHAVNYWSSLGLVVTGLCQSSHVLTICVTNDRTGVRPGETVTNGPLGPVMIRSSFAVICGLDDWTWKH